MKYLQAELMHQEFLVAAQYRDIVPDKYKEVARKYTPDQWVECGKAILQKLEDDKDDLFKMLALIEVIAKEEPIHEEN